MEEKKQLNSFSVDELKELIKAVSESGVTSFEYERDDMAITIKKESIQVGCNSSYVTQPVYATPAVQPSAQIEVTQPVQTQISAVSSDLKIVKSPLVGTFYTSSSPDADAFVKVGDRVSKGQVLGIIEAMKLMNDIESDFDGEIVEILVNNKDMVEYDQPLFKIK